MTGENGMEEILREILAELQTLNATVGELAEKAPLVAPIYNLDDIYNRIGEAISEIAGPSGYNLGDLQSQLVAVETAIDFK